MTEDKEKPGCLLARLYPSDAARFCMEVNKLIKDDEVDLESGGKERDTHVSICFGFDYGFDSGKLKRFLMDQKPFYLTLGAIGCFKKDDGSGVLKVDVEGQQIHDLHDAVVEEFADDIEETFPDYKPHLTLCYLKPDAKAFDLVDSTKFAGETYYFTELVFSYGTSAHRSAEVFKLGQVSESVRRVLSPAHHSKHLAG